MDRAIHAKTCQLGEAIWVAQVGCKKVRISRARGIGFQPMSYVTMEIELDHGRVVAKGTYRLPDKATGPLTILHPAPKEANEASGLGALEALQAHLRVDEQMAAQWIATVRDSRR
jgi:hypothetical protein